MEPPTAAGAPLAPMDGSWPSPGFSLGERRGAGASPLAEPGASCAGGALGGACCMAQTKTLRLHLGPPGTT